MGKQLTRDQRNAKWIEEFCCIPEGKLVGKPVKLTKEQRRWLELIYDSPTRRFILSLARKNAKTAFSAFLLLLHLVGPEARRNGQLYSAAQSRDQAAILFSLAAKIVRMSPDLGRFITIRDTAKQLVCAELGTIYRALSAEASTAYGLSPSFVVHDELGQVKGPRSELYEALETACAAQEDPLTIIISTQAPTDADLLSVLIDDAVAGGDPQTKVVLYTAPEELDPFGEEAIRAANPHYDVFMNKAEVRNQAEAARRMPSSEASYRNLILNQRVEATSPFVAKSIWQANNAKPEELSGRVFAGLDLSETQDLTALVLVSESGGKWHVHPTFWLPEAGLFEKSRKDRVPYDVWHEQGLLQTTPGAAIQYEYVAYHLKQLFDRYDIVKLAFDRYNIKHLKPWLTKVGFSDHDIEEKFVEFGQGYISMSPALRTTEELLLENKLAHGGHPILTMCAANAVVVKDPAGNRKLDKSKSTGRIDGMVALAMALATALEHSQEQPMPEIILL